MTGTTSDDMSEPATTPSRRRRGRGRLAAAGGGIAAVVAAGVVAASLTGSPDDGAGPGPVVPLGPVQRVALQSFASCDALLTYYRGHAGRIVGPWGGLGGSIATPFGAERAISSDGGDADSGSAAAAPAPAGAAKQASDNGATSATGTNVQVAGVDEADSAKLAGDLLLTLDSRGELHVTRVAGRTVTPVSSLNLSPEQVRFPSEPGTFEKFAPQPGGMPLFSPRQLLVHGTRVVVVGDLQQIPTAEVLTSGARKVGGLMPQPMYSPRSRLLELDLSDPAAPRRVRALDVDGAVGAARLVDGVLRVTLTTSPHGFTWRTPVYDRTGNVSKGAERRATEANRREVAAAGIDKWLPGYTLTTFGTDAKPSSGRLLECGDVASPQEFAGVDTLSLLSADLEGDGLAKPESSAVVAQGATVYATPTHTYVATPAWQAWAMADAASRPAGGRATTGIHLFESDGTASRYLASGSVPGHLLNQFAMDESDGVLRVASTTETESKPMPIEPGAGDSGTSSSGAGDAATSSQIAPSPGTTVSQVSVLRRDGKALVTVGKVGGLGRGEQIRSVRFMGDLGYVVTFRQTDPLYTIDLSDPAKPRVAGELKILGYSAYLHPAGPGRLLGVGQDADAEGRVTGLQLSLFDISDPAAPKRLDAVGMGQAWTDVEGDHHAFTLADGLALAPFQKWGQPDPSTQRSEFDAGVVAVRLGGSTLADPGVLRPVANGPVAQPTYGPDEATERIMAATPQRTFVRDGVVYTTTDSGIAAHDARTLARIGFTPFA